MSVRKMTVYKELTSKSNSIMVIRKVTEHKELTS